MTADTFIHTEVLTVNLQSKGHVKSNINYAILPESIIQISVSVQHLPLARMVQLSQLATEIDAGLT